MDAAIEPCPWCAQRSGRYAMTRACCRLRYLAGSPAPRRQAVYARIAAAEGRAAAIALAAQVGRWHRTGAAPIPVPVPAMAGTADLATPNRSTIGRSGPAGHYTDG